MPLIDVTYGAGVDLIRDRLSHLPLGQVGVWLILWEGAWSQN